MGCNVQWTIYNWQYPRVYITAHHFPSAALSIFFIKTKFQKTVHSVEFRLLLHWSKFSKCIKIFGIANGDLNLHSPTRYSFCTSTDSKQVYLCFQPLSTHQQHFHHELLFLLPTHLPIFFVITEWQFIFLLHFTNKFLLHTSFKAEGHKLQQRFYRIIVNAFDISIPVERKLHIQNAYQKSGAIRQAVSTLISILARSLFRRQPKTLSTIPNSIRFFRYTPVFLKYPQQGLLTNVIAPCVSAHTASIIELYIGVSQFLMKQEIQSLTV